MSHGINLAKPTKSWTRYRLARAESKRGQHASLNGMASTRMRFLPFAAGYYLSYMFRMINALIGGQLSSDIGLETADLGVLTSVYFLVFAAAQIPDRHIVGPLWSASHSECSALGRSYGPQPQKCRRHDHLQSRQRSACRADPLCR